MTNANCATHVTAADDPELVAATLVGDQRAFEHIVERYQNLICSIAYSATGNVSHSEDLAQETFITAWNQLRSLREPAKLRAWLCGIARNLVNNWIRSNQRETTSAEPLDVISEAPALDRSPADAVILHEEEVILWRALEQIPELYREPMVLFYREQQSIERVASALDLSTGAVKQRLSRGRKLLHEQVLAVVEGALKHTAPGKTFTTGVIAALPALRTSASAGAIGAAAKGTVASKFAAGGGVFGAILGPFLASSAGTWAPGRASQTRSRTVSGGSCAT